jgi:type I restriction enzyme S subunit
MKMSSTTWPTLPIKNIYKGLYDGPHATPRPAVKGPIFLGIKNVTEDGQLDLVNVRHIAEDDFADWTRRVQPQENDLVFTYEATLNRYALIPDGFRGCLGRRMALIRPNLEVVDVKYLFYYFFTDEWRSVIRNNMLSGSTVDRIPLTGFPDFPVRIPPLPTQRRIAGILSAYDDLIENSQRRIKILEEMARRLYREWFVYFRFPGHEGCRLVDSPLGEIPEGWEVKTLNDVAEDIVDYRGKTPTKLGGEWSDTGIIALSALNVKGGRLVNLEKSKRVEEDLFARWMKNPLRQGDILMTSEAPLGELFFLCRHERYCLSQRLFSIRADRKAISSIILYFNLESEQTQHELRSRASGSTVSGIRQSELRNVPLIIPSLDIQVRAERILQQLAEQIHTLDVQIQNLRSTRDLLLPRLLSGQIDVEALPEPGLSQP